MGKIKIVFIFFLAGLMFAQEISVPAVPAQPVKQYKVIVDAGHGGRDGGTVGSSGLKEKDIVLEISNMLGKALADLPENKFKVILTRDADKFISLEDRIAIANQSEGDIFISIHANASESKNDNGFEVYYNSLVTDDSLIDITERENAGAVEKKDPQPTDSMFILWELAQNEYLKESMDFADDIQAKVEASVTAPKEDGRKIYLRNRGVKQAAFAVLRGVRMPAVLVETSYLSNKNDEVNFKNPEFKERIAKGILDAVEMFTKKLEKQKEEAK